MYRNEPSFYAGMNLCVFGFLLHTDACVVATFDLSASNLHLFKTDHWLSDPRNVIQLHLTSPQRGWGSRLEVVIADAIADAIVRGGGVGVARWDGPTTS